MLGAQYTAATPDRPPLGWWIHDAAVGQSIAFTLGACRSREGRHGGGHTYAVGVNIVTHVLHGVVDG